ncbi:unnamed protein product [Periconia digitata]|uniref:Uncharacterized protein n=1 Tax=Periconia digitata TaxID=1303443 RepID=A0A9W4XRL6_9PLEO|nr:unnamed protein product [Periconia digitata]
MLVTVTMATLGSNFTCYQPSQPTLDPGSYQPITAYLITTVICIILILVSPLYKLLSRDPKNIFTEKPSATGNPYSAKELGILLADQILLTSLGIFGVAFWHFSVGELSLSLWNYVVYVGWVGATVHVVSRSQQHYFSLKRRWSSIRPWIMLLSFGLLSVTAVFALIGKYVHSRDGGSVDTDPINNNTCDDGRPGSTLLRGKFDAIFIAGYMTSTSAFAFFIGHTSNYMVTYYRRRCRNPLEACWEHTMQNLSRRQPFSIAIRIRFKALMVIHAHLITIMDMMESSTATIMLLILSRAIGPSALDLFAGARKSGTSPVDTVGGGEQEPFGQIVMCSLLLQPALAVVCFIVGIKQTRKSYTEPRILPVAGSPHPPITYYSTLSDLLRDPTVQLLTAAEKSDNLSLDPVTAHIYRSRTMKDFTSFMLFKFLASLIFVLGLTGFREGLPVNLLWVYFLGWLSIVSIVNCSFLAWSKKLS